jgi:hypothetical protein
MVILEQLMISKPVNKFSGCVRPVFKEACQMSLEIMKFRSGNNLTAQLSHSSLAHMFCFQILVNYFLPLGRTRFITSVDCFYIQNFYRCTLYILAFLKKRRRIFTVKQRTGVMSYCWRLNKIFNVDIQLRILQRIRNIVQVTLFLMMFNRQWWKFRLLYAPQKGDISYQVLESRSFFH